ncbi:hypothetical protein EJ05DRAFT_139817 [Pseudovirgaria hyperparasitica]|uniref:Uncharacterized protein n=1 Tax=Pseudovirgaria hyperparasitica TaxID=470096 RepID=A0A6A6VX56_9PEZI|nr:uncharacterized protein EJ05DRAFT_139817 [Pseudovirgaria hyperparasitica]KAF2754386.1 hypothetical protein EJ05DRAFT_139817 [Pseudovirgaria hyperparasitica]
MSKGMNTHPGQACVVGDSSIIHQGFFTSCQIDQTHTCVQHAPRTSVPWFNTSSYQDQGHGFRGMKHENEAVRPVYNTWTCTFEP